jgi:2-polyprenyl-3-methyl-5-hydroxy-6-metoxy-1,4-benzoquinol methylase
MRDISYLVSIITRWRFKKLLDIGIGYGVLAHTLRRMVEPYKFDKSKWVLEIDGIEVNKHYITPMHKFLYNDIVIGDIQNIKVKEYDIIVASEIFEHLHKSKAMDIIRELKDKCKLLVITVPYGFKKQGMKNNNKYEVHLSSWSPEDFLFLGGFEIVIQGSEILAVHRGKGFV